MESDCHPDLLGVRRLASCFFAKKDHKDHVECHDSKRWSLLCIVDCKTLKVLPYSQNSLVRSFYLEDPVGV